MHMRRDDESPWPKGEGSVYNPGTGSVQIFEDYIRIKFVFGIWFFQQDAYIEANVCIMYVTL